MQKKYKTRFPVARIKKIMQLDEEVGKMTQTTPVLMSKAIELFMQSLIGKTCIETRSQQSKRMSAAHLKNCIFNTEQFDFLKELVDKKAQGAPIQKASLTSDNSNRSASTQILEGVPAYVPRAQNYATVSPEKSISPFSGPGGLAIMNPEPNSTSSNISSGGTFSHLLPPPPFSNACRPTGGPSRRRGRPKGVRKPKCTI
ncbi:hypothetical protein DSO57_1017581 [Entomophthora muscae]|uniref:Uncharacterized protein n=1 Tax=Entomophthora muscae TaxID=34485 RepID=A0ACC2UDC9_9FUNG|nr:hypothetical protein DSO57_1017581 [Entomophthora muscae]